MWRTLRLALVFLPTCAFLFSQQHAPTKAPQFDDFSVPAGWTGKPATPVFSTPFQREYRTMIRDAVSKGPNFAAHYTIATAGCGGGCILGALVDLQSGKTYDLPFKTLTASSAAPVENDPEPLTFRKSSRLLIASGCLNEDSDKCGTSYYEWTGNQFRLRVFHVEHQLRPTTLK